MQTPPHGHGHHTPSSSASHDAYTQMRWYRNIAVALCVWVKNPYIEKGTLINLSIALKSRTTVQSLY